MHRPYLLVLRMKFDHEFRKLTSLTRTDSWPTRRVNSKIVGDLFRLVGNALDTLDICSATA